jgi:hypothetical protein
MNHIQVLVQISSSAQYVSESLEKNIFPHPKFSDPLVHERFLHRFNLIFCFVEFLKKYLFYKYLAKLFIKLRICKFPTVGFELQTFEVQEFKA